VEQLVTIRDIFLVSMASWHGQDRTNRRSDAESIVPFRILVRNQDDVLKPRSEALSAKVAGTSPEV
jgi:hypothetical protein